MLPHLPTLLGELNRYIKNPGEWDAIKETEQFITPVPYIVDPPYTKPWGPSQIRFVCVSDLHSAFRTYEHSLPPGDVFLVGGDITDLSTQSEMIEFCHFLDSLPYKNKIVVAGNHDTSLLDQGDSKSQMDPKKNPSIQMLNNHCTFLHNEVTCAQGITVYGASMPTSALLGTRNNKRETHWDPIPDGVDIILTHLPPLGRGDQPLGNDGFHQGDSELLKAVRRVRPKVHVFGHKHFNPGVSYDGTTVFINAAVVMTHVPIVFDLPRPLSHLLNRL